MLKTTKSIILNGNSEIEGQPVVNLFATIPDNTVVGNINQNIQNAELYEKIKLLFGKTLQTFKLQFMKLKMRLLQKLLNKIN